VAWLPIGKEAGSEEENVVLAPDRGVLVQVVGYLNASGSILVQLGRYLVQDLGILVQSVGYVHASGGVLVQTGGCLVQGLGILVQSGG
jgi:hypothetical protein